MSTLLHNLPHYLEVALVFLLLVVMLVAAHEFGHYLFARLFGMGVEEFSIGMFGKKPLMIWLRRTYRIRLKPDDDPYKKSVVASGLNFEGLGTDTEPVVIENGSVRELQETTVFTVRPVPIGGFVRIKGMVPEEDGSEIQIPGGFYSKPPWQRLVVLFAGPLFSILFGVLIMVPVFMLDGLPTSSNKPVIGDMMVDKPAYQAGIRPGDRIVSIDGQPIATFYQVIEKVRDNPNRPLDFVFSHKGATKEAKVTPYLESQALPVLGPDLQPTGELRRQGMLGVFRSESLVKLDLSDAAVASIRLPITTVVGLVSMIHAPSTAKDSVGGLGTMLKVTSDAVDAGTLAVLETAAIISISLGIMNLLPIFPLDGGQIVVALAEMLRRGRRLSLQVQNMVGTLGLCLVALLVVGVLATDVGRYRDSTKERPKPKIATVEDETTTKPALHSPTKPVAPLRP